MRWIISLAGGVAAAVTGAAAGGHFKPDAGSMVGQIHAPRLETAAADLYANPWQCFRHVTLPLLAPGILAGAMLAFVISLDDVVITEFVKSGGQDTLPTYMLGQMRRAITPEVNAISTGLLGLTVILLTAFFLLTRKRG